MPLLTKKVNGGNDFTDYNSLMESERIQYLFVLAHSLY